MLFPGSSPTSFSERGYFGETSYRAVARDGDRDQVRCGPGRDVAWTDIKDRTSGCEVVHRRKPNNR
jgi:hypothetical protein